MRKNNKNKKKNIKNIRGGISIETVLTYSIILSVGTIGIYFLNDKFNDSKNTLSNNLEDKYENKNVVINIEESPNINNPIENDNDNDILLGETSKEDKKMESLYFDLDLNGQQERITTFKLNDLKEIDNISVDNGNIEILSVDGENVTVKVTGGNIKERVVVSGQYVASQTKNIENELTANYSDADGFVGTLTRYLAYYSVPYTKSISLNEKSLINSFLTTISYTEDDVTISLTKNGASIVNVIKGSTSHTKYVTNQTTANYSEDIDDNGKTGTYTGTLTQYLHSGEAPLSKTSVTTQSNTTNAFPVTITFQDGDYSGTLTKSGRSTSVVTRGSSSVTKEVTAQLSSRYNEPVVDNGKNSAYTGNLSAYVYQGSVSDSKTGTNSILSIENDFPETNNYTETINDNGVSTTYTGVLTKTGDVIATTIKGSPLSNKFVEAKDNAIYEENINDNGVNTSYTGNLTEYLYKGSNSSTKTGRDSKINLTNIFDDTISYNEVIDDNGVSTSYTGILSKDGASIKRTIKGSDTLTKYVTNQNSATYNETVNDNGITTAYTGTLTEYVSQGSESANKTVTDSRTNNNNSFENTITYSETINDNGVTTTYTGTLSKNGNPSTRLLRGSDANNFSINDTKVNYNGLFDDSIYYNYDFNDNGVYTSYSGTMYKSGNVSTRLISGSAADNKYVTDQLNSWYDDGTYSGTLTPYIAGGLPEHTKYVISQLNAWYDDGTYSGTLMPYIAGGLPEHTKYLTDQLNAWYNDGTYSGTLTAYTKTISEEASKYVSQQSSINYSDNEGFSGRLTKDATPYERAVRTYNASNPYAASSYTYGRSCQSNGQIAISTKSTNQPPSTRYYNISGFTGTLNLVETRVTHDDPYGEQLRGCGYTPTSTVIRFKYNYYYAGTASNPNLDKYYYSGTVVKPAVTATRYQGNVTRPSTEYTHYHGNVTRPSSEYTRYEGTVYKADTRVYEYTQNYSGTAYKSDTRVYEYTQNYIGTAYKPDTRIYKYQGNVIKPDTRVYEYTQNYVGTVSKPDTRIYKFRGNVTKPDTRVYGYEQTYSGIVSKPDTRVYRFRGNVTKPDTREYLYTETYTGTTYTPDTRVYRYQGTVTKPDTRVYEYTQNYIGVLNVPERAIYRYKGDVTKPAIDTRTFNSLYQYRIKADYYK